MELEVTAKLKYEEDIYYSDYISLNISFRKKGHFFKTKLSYNVIDSGRYDSNEEFYRDIVSYLENRDIIEDDVRQEVKKYFSMEDKIMKNNMGKDNIKNFVKNYEMKIKVNTNK